MTKNDLPLWRSHKLIRGFEIAQMVPLEGTSQLRLIDPTGQHIVDVSNQYVMRYRPYVGGYYALYSDGYESFSPSDAWLAGYTKVDESAPSDLSDDQIRAIFLENGFKLKDQGDGKTDLNPYVYTAARALLHYASSINKK